jgi:hypothetical protein
MLCTWHCCQFPAVENELLCRRHIDLEKLLKRTVGDISSSNQLTECQAIKYLIDNRGVKFTVHFLKEACLSYKEILNLYMGKEIEEQAFLRVQTVLKERLSR